MKRLCGDANRGGNVYLFYKGACKKPIKLKDSYRCTGCGGSFHKDCILKHFEEEKKHDFGRNKVKQDIEAFIINNSIPSNEIVKLIRGIRNI